MQLPSPIEVNGTWCQIFASPASSAASEQIPATIGPTALLYQQVQRHVARVLQTGCHEIWKDDQSTSKACAKVLQSLIVLGATKHARLWQLRIVCLKEQDLVMAIAGVQAF